MTFILSPDGTARVPRMVFLFAAFILLLLICTSISSAEEQPLKKKEQIIIGTKEAPPFSMKNDEGEWGGISIELIKILSDSLGVEYTFKEYDLEGLLEAVQKNSVDMAAAALTITSEREKKFDFTHAFHTSGLGIAVLKDSETPWLRIAKRILSVEFLKAVLALSGLILAVGIMIWLFERKKNQEQFGGGPLAGIGSGFWWSAVTMTTVGYGDKAPRSLLGRMIGLVWMFMAIITISGFTAAITSTLTVDKFQTQIRGPEDLKHIAVGSVKHSTSVRYLDAGRISCREYPTVSDALDALLNGEVDAVVYDLPILRYLAASGKFERVHLLKSVFEKQLYGIALPSGSPFREKINQTIPSITGSSQWKGILFQYLGESGF